MKRIFLCAFIALAVASCGGGSSNSKHTDTYEGLTESGPIDDYSRSEIQLRQLELINAIRQENNVPPVQISAQLTAAGLTHARDIAAQQRAWNFGSDHSTPQTRANRAGYIGTVTGENVSETYRGELQVMQSWLNDPMSRAVVLDPRATDVGIAYFMERSGKVWWVQDFGAAGASQSTSGF